MSFAGDLLSYVCSQPPVSGADLQPLGGALVTLLRVPMTLPLVVSRCPLEDESQRALITAPSFPGISSVVGAYTEGAFPSWALGVQSVCV